LSLQDWVVEIHCKCVEKYGIVENAISIIVKEFCATNRKHLKPLVILKPLVKSLFVLKSFHEIIYILDTINDGHIPIITPKINLKSYYYWKDFYSTLNQKVVHAKCSFGDYDYGWACSVHG